MRKTKANEIKILAAMRDNNYELAKTFDKNSAEYKKYRAEGNALQEAIWLISNYNNSFEGYGKIYFPDEFPNK